MNENLVGYCFLKQLPGLNRWVVVAKDKKGNELALVSTWEDVSENPYLSQWEVEVRDASPCGKRKLYLRKVSES